MESDAESQNMNKENRRARVAIPSEQIADFCCRHHIKKLALFGSVLRDDFRAESDIGVLVEFEEGRTPGLFQLARMERELATIFDRSVDIRTAEDLSRYFRDDVLSTAEIQYAEG